MATTIHHDGAAFEKLPNGFIRGRSHSSGLVGLFEADGRPRSGDLARVLGPLNGHLVATITAANAAQR